MIFLFLSLFIALDSGIFVPNQIVLLSFQSDLAQCLPFSQFHFSLFRESVQGCGIGIYMPQFRGHVGEQVIATDLFISFFFFFFFLFLTLLLLCSRFLSELDDDLLHELDAVCRDNQMACYPISRGRNSEDYIFEVYPEIVSLLDRDRKRRVDSMKLKSRLSQVGVQDDEERPRTAVNEKTPAALSTPDKENSVAMSSREAASATRSPALRPKQSTGDLMFQMDEEASLTPSIPAKAKGAVRGSRIASNESHAHPSSLSPGFGSSLGGEGDSLDDHQGYLDERMASINSITESPLGSKTTASFPTEDVSSPPSGPWGSPGMPTAKKDLKAIMEEASQSRLSNLTLGMSARRDSSITFSQKPSQKERKRLQQQQMQDMLAGQQKAKEAPRNPWQAAASSSSTASQGAAATITPTTPTTIKTDHGESNTTPSESTRSNQKPPSMTLRQTIAGASPLATSKPDPGAAALQAGSPSSNNVQPSPRTPTTAVTNTNTNTITTTPVQSIRHIPRPDPTPNQTIFNSPSSNPTTTTAAAAATTPSASTATSTSLAAISLQQQTEKDEIREAATAKHNLQDIQAEQEFQEWWDKESKRVREQADAEEAALASASAVGKAGGRSGGRGGGSGKGQGHHHHHAPRNNNSSSSNNNSKRRPPKGSTPQSSSTSSDFHVSAPPDHKGHHQNVRSGGKKLNGRVPDHHHHRHHHHHQGAGPGAGSNKKKHSDETDTATGTGTGGNRGSSTRRGYGYGYGQTRGKMGYEDI